MLLLPRCGILAACCYRAAAFLPHAVTALRHSCRMLLPRCGILAACCYRVAAFLPHAIVVKEPMKLRIQQAGLEDLALIAQLAQEIWWACYPGIVSEEQIAYMLRWMYAEDKITEQVRTDHSRFFLAYLKDDPVGFFAVQIRSEAIFLDKLYLRKSLHGQGMGQQMLGYVDALALKHGVGEIELRVNRKNERAVRAYQRAGYAVLREQCDDIGNGFLMDDYIMIKRIMRDNSEQ
jgi:GNAT superfamily N-acetyltransferase